MLETIVARFASHRRDGRCRLRSRARRRPPLPRRGGVFSLLASVGVLTLPLCAACGEAPARGGSAASGPARLSTFVFGTLQDGRDVTATTLLNRNGLEIEVIAYGAILRAVRVPDNSGSLGDITLGFDDLAGYLGDSPYFGAVVGRYANRIAEGRYELDGVSYELDRNDGPHHLHGGNRGFDKVLWTLETRGGEGRASVHLGYESAAGEAGYPGRLSARVTYTLTDSDELVMDYRAVTDAPTPVNLSQHSYFNLSAGANRDVLGHELLLHADFLTPVDETLIPTGEIAPVAETPFDFTTPRRIEERIGEPHPQLLRGRGYDHNFVLRGQSGRRTGDVSGSADTAGLAHAARVRDPVSGRMLDIFTSEPGIQFYSGNFLDGSIAGKGGRVYGHRSGFCLETQHYPDSPNQPGFPNTILRPGDEYHSRTVWRFTLTPTATPP